MVTTLWCITLQDGAIVHNEPGITRDRTYRTGSWCDYNFQVVDTGGIVFDDTSDIFAERITQQALIALQEAQVLHIMQYTHFVADGICFIFLFSSLIEE